MAVMLGGRAAEKAVFGEFSTGAQNDLKQVMDLAEKMVCQWGMSDELGPVAFKKGETHPFLGRELAEDRDYSEHTARVIDEEVKRITLDMEKKACQALEDKPALLDALAAALLEHETLSREEIDAVLQEAGMRN
jgi:cell division protease FtsH